MGGRLSLGNDRLADDSLDAYISNFDFCESMFRIGDQGAEVQGS
jgi:hypothetical protein